MTCTRRFQRRKFLRASLAASLAAVFAGALAAQTARAEDVKSDPPAKKADPTGQPSPQGDPGQLNTDSVKGNYPTNPQGGTPNAQQAKPEGSDTGNR